MLFFVEKKVPYRVEAFNLKQELNINLDLDIKELRIIDKYDINISEEFFNNIKYKIFAELPLDDIYFEIEAKDLKKIEYYPKTESDRINAIRKCLYLYDSNNEYSIETTRIILIDKSLNDSMIDSLKNHLIFSDTSSLEKEENKKTLVDTVLDGFIDLNPNDYDSFIKEHNLSINAKDLKFIIDYFKNENRNPTLVEIKLLDNYWSDHSRHTTFNTKITDIQIDRSFASAELQEALDLYINVRKDLKRENRTFSLMDMATIGAKYLKRIGRLNDLEKTGENNAFSLKTNVDVDGKNEKWSIQYKNETNNHPTEIDPFNGAACSIGGAMRDLIASRAIVFQGLRVSGAADIYKNSRETIKGKIPQKILSTKSALGASTYGNRVGITTSYLKEFYHNDYVAKRLESCFLVGASKISDIRREKPKDGDFILLVGNKTNNEGVENALDSSLPQTSASIKDKKTQKANPTTAKKFNNLLKRKEATALIKKANDLGAGGIGVGVGEIYSGVEIWLDDVLINAKNLDSLDLLFAETQERVAFVVSPEEKDELVKYIKEEDLDVSYVGKITSSNNLVIWQQGKKLCDISRKFIDTAGALRYAEAVLGKIEEKNPFVLTEKPLVDAVFDTLSSPNVVIQKGLVEQFDSTLGRSSVLLPYGGKYQLTESQVSAVKIPVNGKTTTVSLASFGFNPHLTEWSPYHGSIYAIIESISKLVASGASYKNIRLSFQEYFEKMLSAESWGKAISCMLGALKMQLDFKIPSIGGKDSVAGTFNNISVPPTFISYAFTTVKEDEIITPEFKSRGHKLYLVKHLENKDYSPNVEQLIDNFEFVKYNILKGHIVSAYSIGYGGLLAACAKMSLGNSVGFYLNVNEKELTRFNYGSIICEVAGNLEIPEDTNPNFMRVGRTSHVQFGVINGVKFSIPSLCEALTKKYNRLFKADYDNSIDVMHFKPAKKKVSLLRNKEEVTVYVPLFEGTIGAGDVFKAFSEAGGNIITSRFKDRTKTEYFESINILAENIYKTDILVLCGDYFSNNEPNGGGKFLSNVLNHNEVRNAINNLVERKGLILGISDGFKALLKAGYFEIGNEINETSLSINKNNTPNFVSSMVQTRIMSNASPWLYSYKGGEIILSAFASSEGKLELSKKKFQELIKAGMVASIYVNKENDPANNASYNPAGSSYALEGLLSRNGLILGKMTHPERIQEDLYKNIYGNKDINIFKNAINYFKKEKVTKNKRI